MTTGADIPGAVRQAELEINATLARFEAETGRVVEALSLRTTDVTGVDPEGREVLTGAVIALQQAPGHRRWESKA